MINHMQEIVPFLPNVEAIELQTREELDGGRIRIVRRWQGNDNSAPKAVRPFLKRDMLAWIDEATWFPKENKVEWRLSTITMAKLYDCSGVNFFEPHPAAPEETRIRITGDLVVHPRELPGVPGFMAKKLAPKIEEFVVNLITPNLTDVAQGLQGYFDAKK